MSTWLDTGIENAVKRVKEIAAEVKDFPHITEKGQWKTTPDGIWTGGFWAGLLWLAHQHDRKATTLALAESYTDRIIQTAEIVPNHDLGFMFFPTAIKGWEVTGNKKYRDAALAAAKTLAGQFNHGAGFIPGWGFFGGQDWSGSVLIDTLMNLPLLHWAATQGADEALRNIAIRHAETSLNHHIRNDGSVYHVYKFNPENGDAIGGGTYQGLDAESSWARGHGWAVTGLAILAQMTGNQQYLKTSEKIAQYFLKELPKDLISPWDFTADPATAPKDSSATAIVAYGLLKLYEVTGNAKHLHDAALLLAALVHRCGNTTSRGGILLHATADLPHGLGIDESTMYGDYYYLKALLKYKELSANA